MSPALPRIVLSLFTLIGLLTTAYADDSKKAAPKKAAKAGSGGSSGGLQTPKEEFGKAGKSGENYEDAGKAAVKGGKSLGTKTADGDVVGGAGDFGKSMGTVGKNVGVGTAKVGTSVGRGVGSVFSGGKRRSKSK
jgi:hypothetical protein